MRDAGCAQAGPGEVSKSAVHRGRLDIASSHVLQPEPIP